MKSVFVRLVMIDVVAGSLVLCIARIGRKKRAAACDQANVCLRGR